MTMTNEDSITLKALIDGLDHTARELEAKWGVERLPLLVDADLRGKFERQRAKTYQAIEKAFQGDFLSRDTLEGVTSAVGALQRGWKAMDAAATADRQLPIGAVTTVLEGRTNDGHVLAIVATNAEAHHVLAEGRAVVVMTLEEVANLLACAGTIVTDTLRLFPGTKVSPPRHIKPDWYATGGDEIPF